jgi:hypothetical protein
MRWHLQSNKHPNTNGTAWGWIEGPTPRLYWSNEFGSGYPTREQAERMVAEHNAREAGRREQA